MKSHFVHFQEIHKNVDITKNKVHGFFHYHRHIHTHFIEPGIKLVYLIYRNCDYKKNKNVINNT